MAEILCPQCGKANGKELEECQFCGTRLKPRLASTPSDSKPIQAGEEPVARDTSEFEKVKPLDEGPIHPGEAPVERDTGELEQALPTWLKNLRQGEDSASESFPDLGLPSAAGAGEAADSSSGNLSDWLSGLDKAASQEDEEEVPDWLAGLRGGPAPSTPESVPEANIPAVEADWMKTIGSELRGQADDSAAEPTPGAEEPAPAVSAGASLPGWFDQLEEKEPAPAATGDASTPEWLSGLPGLSAESENTPAPLPESASSGDLPDWLNQLKQKAAEPEPVAGATPEPDWLAGFGSEPGAPAAATGESVPEWLSNIGQKPGTGSLAEALSADTASPGAPPDWLAQLQSDVNAADAAGKPRDEFEQASEPEKKEEGPLPDWLAGIGDSAPTARAGTALILSDESNTTGQEGETAFALEPPDWLTKLKPEERAEKRSAGEEEPTGAELEAAELPSWVQAMRPVEAVVSDEPRLPSSEEGGGEVEQSGPLAGLQGVLPASPGLGPLRKPPAYSIKLQVTETQRKYAAYLERLVTQETQARGPGAARLGTSRVWRWVISGLLFAVTLLALLTGQPFTPDILLPPNELVAARAVVDAVSPGEAVLVVFDYDPAFFGEMEAAAAPLMQHLLWKNPRLAFISTSPTGPALAERFMLETQPDSQYVDLGYLAGGPTGVLGFASSPRAAAGTNEDWQSPQLVGVNGLGDFALIVILTDNADTGRVWLEQTQLQVNHGTPADPADDTPIVMAISAQAEPMLVPYYDSGQVRGIVTGLVGGKVYEAKNNEAQPGVVAGLASRYWNAFGAATALAELLILGGAVWGAFSGWQARKKKTGEEA